MATVQKTLNECLDEAVATMPVFRRIAWNTRLAFSGFRRKTLAELRERLHDDERSPKAFQATIAEDTFTADTPFAIDVEKLRELLKLILEFLPLILKFFSGFGAILLALVLLPATADAQLFPRLRGYQTHSTNCPGGVCPTQQSYSYVGSSRGHWTYPGDIASHLRGTHRQSVSGLSREQMLDLHDALHEGRSTPRRKANLPSSVMATAPLKQVQTRIPETKIGWL